MRPIIRIITACAVLVSFDPLATTAQQRPGSAPSRGTGWLPRGSRLYTVDYKITPAELSAVINRLTEVERMFVQASEIARPVGFEIEPTLYGFSPNESVLSYSYGAMFYVPSKKIAGEGTDCLSVSFNQVPGRGLNGMEGYRDDRGAFFFEDPRGEPIPGATHVWHRLSPTERSWVDVMFTSGNVSPLEPVSRRRFQRAKVRFFEAFQSGLASKTSYEKWMAEAPQRKAERKGVAAALPPAQAAALLKTLEDTERQTTESLRAADAADRAETTRQVTAFPQMADRARAQLAAMPAAERPLPAWIERRAEQLSPGVNPFSGDLAPLVSPDTPLAARVFVPQPDLYRGQRSRVNPRVIQVHLSGSLTCNIPAVQRAMFQAYQKLDWTDFSRMVDSDNR
jgi:hypothetical protein